MRDNEERTPVQDDIYYGPTCTLHVLSPSDPTRNVPTSVSLGSDVQIDMDSLQLKNMLVDNYCKFQTLTVTVIHRENFLSDRDRGLRSR